MKKLFLVLFFIFLIATPSYALNVVDAMLGKKVLLTTVHRTVLVNRLTGEVKYLLGPDNAWVLLTGPAKKQFQAFYDVQVSMER